MLQVAKRFVFTEWKFFHFSYTGPSVESVNDDGNVDNDTCEEWERHEALHNDVQPNR